MGSASTIVSGLASMDVGSAGLGETAPFPAHLKPPDSLAALAPAPAFASSGLVSGFFFLCFYCVVYVILRDVRHCVT